MPYALWKCLWLIIDPSITFVKLPIGIRGAESKHEDAPPIPLEPGDVLLLITDGVWEESGPSGERFGKDRLIESFIRVADGSPRETVESIQKEVCAFTQGALRKDDFTIVAIKRVG